MQRQTPVNNATMRLLLFVVLCVVSMWYAACIPTAPVKQQAAFGPAAADLLQHTFTCYYYSTCPANPTMGAPCFQYTSADTATYGSGKLFFTIGPGNMLYRTTAGNLPFAHYSYAYPTDSLAFDIVNDTLLLLHTNTPERDSLKITVITDSVIALNYISAQFGHTVEIDSLKR